MIYSSLKNITYKILFVRMLTNIYEVLKNLISYFVKLSELSKRKAYVLRRSNITI